MAQRPVYLVSRSARRAKKLCVVLPDGSRVHFGAKGYEDYTVHKDPGRKRRYIARHAVAETWGKLGIATAGFWARWLLWNRPTLAASARDVERRFHVRILCV